jgi:hypothetical protein
MNSTPGPGYKGRHGRVLVIRCRGLEESCLWLLLVRFAFPFMMEFAAMGRFFLAFRGFLMLDHFPCAAFCVKANACALGNCSLPWSHFLMLDRFLVPHSV